MLPDSSKVKDRTLIAEYTGEDASDLGNFPVQDIQSSFENFSQEKIQSAIDIKPKVMEAIIAADGGHTTSMSNGSAKKGDCFL